MSERCGTRFVFIEVPLLQRGNSVQIAKPLSAYAFFQKDAMRRIKDANPDLELGEVMRQVGKEVRMLPL